MISPWSAESLYKDAAEKNVLGGLSPEGFLSEVFTVDFLFSLVSLPFKFCSCLFILERQSEIWTFYVIN